MFCFVTLSHYEKRITHLLYFFILFSTDTNTGFTYSTIVQLRDFSFILLATSSVALKNRKCGARDPKAEFNCIALMRSKGRWTDG